MFSGVGVFFCLCVLTVLYLCNLLLKYLSKITLIRISLSVCRGSWKPIWEIAAWLDIFSWFLLHVHSHAYNETMHGIENVSSECSKFSLIFTWLRGNVISWSQGSDDPWVCSSKDQTALLSGKAGRHWPERSSGLGARWRLGRRNSLWLTHPSSLFLPSSLSQIQQALTGLGYPCPSPETSPAAFASSSGTSLPLQETNCTEKSEKKSVLV